MSEKLENNIRALKVELQAADKIIERLKKNPQCPDCGGRMTRVQWECQDGSGWQAGWLCNCKTNAHGRRIRPNTELSGGGLIPYETHDPR